MIEFDRKPQGIMDGIEVFLPLGPIGRLDEYQQRNPYRTDLTKQSVWDQARFRMILEETEGRDVLDLGSGEGELSRALACKHQVEGLDISISAVRMARSSVSAASMSSTAATSSDSASNCSAWTHRRCLVR